MIGGVDRHFPIPANRLPEALDSVAHAILRRWRSAVFQSMEGQTFSSLSDVPLSTATELFVYRNSASFDQWEKFGATAENSEEMIHLLAGPEGLTLVVGNPAETVAAGVLKELERLRFGSELPRRPA